MNNQFSKTDVPPIAFLGVCERVNIVERGHPLALQYNILNLEKVIFSYIFPLNLSVFKYVFALFDPLTHAPFNIRLFSPSNKEVMKIDIDVTPIKEESSIDVPSLKKIDSTTNCSTSKENPSWVIAIPDIQNLNAIIEEPGTYKVVLIRGEKTIHIGELLFQYIKAQPFSESQIAAIRSNPFAHKKVKMLIKCNLCQDEIKIYAGLEKDQKEEASGVIWYLDIPELQKCKCEKTEFNFKYVRENLYALLGEEFKNKPELSITKLYEVKGLEEIAKRFASLLKQDPKEEEMQEFIENNPILLQQFSPKGIFYKAPILSKNKTDIVIWNYKKEILLIELEKPSIRLLNKNGGIAGQLQHAFDQVSSWLRHVDRHHVACMECINIKYEDVTKVLGIVIAGRDGSYPSEHLSDLKSRDFARISFFTYDDLLRNLVALIRRLKEI
jgi:hypothetical protein